MQTLRMLKKMFSLGKANIGLFVTSITSIIIASILVVIGIGLIVPVINSLAIGGDFLSNLKIPLLVNFIKLIHIKSNLAIFTFLMFLIMFLVYLSDIFLFINIICLSKFSVDFEYTIRTKIFERCLSFEKSFYDKTRSGHLISLIFDVPVQIRNRISSTREALVSIIMALAYLTTLFFISWKLTLLALPILVSLYYSTEWLAKKVKASTDKGLKAWQDLASHGVDILQNTMLVKSHANEESEKERFIKKSNPSKFHSFNVMKKDAAIPLISDVVGITGFLFLVFVWVVLYIKTGNFLFGKFVVYFFVLRYFVNYAKGINVLIGQFAQLAPLAEKIIWVFDDSDKEYLKNGDIELLNLKDKIQFKNLNFRYIKERQILKDINFTIQRGQNIAIIGPTGSGKTTIAHLLCRFYDPESGSIAIDGEDIRNFTSQSLRKNIAIVTQETMLFNDTLKNNIIYGIDRGITQEELDEVAKKAYLYDFIISLPEKYNTFIGDRGVKLSGGEKQRLAIARSIIKDSDILILDEATSSLDSETEILIQKAIKNLTQGKTVLAIAHRLSTIKGADRIIVLESGEITEQGSPDELLEKKGRFFYYWNLQKFF